jgi:oxygen-dependent protoporphyrinogen oxidase
MGDRHVVVVGGGITGLAAAYRLVTSAPRTRVTLVEAGVDLGGKLRTVPLAGRPCDTGAEAFLTSDPSGGPSAAAAMAIAVGLGDDLVHPANGRAAIAVGGALRPLPAGTLMGVPGDLAALDGLAVPVADRDSDDGRPLLAAGADTTIGELVRRRLGDDVLAHLVDPMLGGVYAGNADAISLRMAIPALADAATRERTITSAVRAAAASRRAPAGTPVFTTVVGGLGRLVGAVADRLRAEGVRIHLDTPVTGLERVGAGWLVTADPAAGSAAGSAGGGAAGPLRLAADGVVLAVPAHLAARLLPAVAAVPVAYASVALVTLALPGPALPDLSGLLVPSDQGYAVKAATFFDVKWAHLRRSDGISTVRASIGRFGDEAQLARDDAGLVSLALGDLAGLLRTPLPEPVDTVVARWTGALPQYPAGHADRVAALRAGLDPTIAVAGAGYDGIGIPVCIRSGYVAADAVAAAVGGAPVGVGAGDPGRTG